MVWGYLKAIIVFYDSTLPQLKLLPFFFSLCLDHPPDPRNQPAEQIRKQML